jgi:hypothetical protein
MEPERRGMMRRLYALTFALLLAWPTLAEAG